MDILPAYSANGSTAFCSKLLERLTHHTLSGISRQPETSKLALMKASTTRNKVAQKYTPEKLNYPKTSAFCMRKTNATFSCLAIPVHDDV